MPRNREAEVALYFASRILDGMKIALGTAHRPPVMRRTGINSVQQRTRDMILELSNFRSKRRQSRDVNEIIQRASMAAEGIRQLIDYKLTRQVATGLPSIPINIPPVLPSMPSITSPVSIPEMSEMPPIPSISFDTTESADKSTEIPLPLDSPPVPPPPSPAPVKQSQPSSSKLDLRAPSLIPPTERKISKNARESRVPSSRLGRIGSFGSLIAGVGIGSIAEATRRTVGLSNSTDLPLFMTEANLNRIVETLCKVRGAALKLGQIISIQDEAIVPPAVAAAFERVRQAADFMPTSQMEQMMSYELGTDWREKHFSSFNDKPFAAASIGQVHEAVLKSNGASVAVKIQYPGVAEGIDSDIKNLVTLVKMWKIIPDGMYLDNVMRVARKELSWELDYQREAECQQKFRKFMQPYTESERIAVPQVYTDVSTKKIFVSDLVPGVPIDRLFTNDDVPQELKNLIAQRLLRLTLREVFEFKLVQTDPNFSNYLYDAVNDKIWLLDFGATREYSDEFMDKYLDLIEYAADQDYDGVVRISKELGFLTGFESKLMEEAHANAVLILGEAFSAKHVGVNGKFDFGRQSTTKRIAGLIPAMVKHRLAAPPEETYSLHRRMSGVFLLCAKLKAQVDCKSIFDPFRKHRPASN